MLYTVHDRHAADTARQEHPNRQTRNIKRTWLTQLELACHGGGFAHLHMQTTQWHSPFQTYARTRVTPHEKLSEKTRSTREQKAHTSKPINVPPGHQNSFIRMQAHARGEWYKAEGTQPCDNTNNARQPPLAGQNATPHIRHHNSHANSRKAHKLHHK